MEKRELYQKKYEAQLAEWSAKLDVLKARAAKKTAQARIDMQPTIEALQTRYDAAKARISEFASATEDRWHEFTESLERGWNDLKASAEGAVAALGKDDDAKDDHQDDSKDEKKD